MYGSKIKYPLFKGNPVLNDTIKSKLLNPVYAERKTGYQLKYNGQNFLNRMHDFKKDNPKSEMYYILDSYVKVIGRIRHW
jgi:hypothetical protein